MDVNSKSCVFLSQKRLQVQTLPSLFNLLSWQGLLCTLSSFTDIWIKRHQSFILNPVFDCYPESLMFVGLCLCVWNLLQIPDKGIYFKLVSNQWMDKTQLRFVCQGGISQRVDCQSVATNTFRINNKWLLIETGIEFIRFCFFKL